VSYYFHIIEAKGFINKSFNDYNFRIKFYSIIIFRNHYKEKMLKINYFLTELTIEICVKFRDKNEKLSILKKTWK